MVLSGIGGDEVAGGVPTPTPELMDLLASARFKELARKLKLWAIQSKETLVSFAAGSRSRIFPSCRRRHTEKPPARRLAESPFCKAPIAPRSRAIQHG